MANRICSIDGCDRPVRGRGWCINHWTRWRNHGDPLGGRPAQAVIKAIDHDDDTRTCSQCRERLPIDQFDKVKNATLGRRSNCKTCRSAQMKARYAADREAYITYQRRRRAELYAAKVAADPEHFARLEAEKAWNAECARRVDSTQYRRKRRIAERRSDPGVNRKNLREQYGDHCFYCESLMSFAPRRRTQKFSPDMATLEHVVPIAEGGTHTWDNTVLACWACNGSKNRTALDVWLVRRESAA